MVVSFRLLSILFLCISGQSVCMEVVGQDYFKKCGEVRNKDEKKLQRFLLNACNTKPKREMEKVENKLQNIKKSLYEKRDDALSDIKKKYNISDIAWAFYRNETEKIYEFELADQRSSLDNVIHNKAIPADFLLILKKTFLDNGVNLNRFNINIHDYFDLVFSQCPLRCFVEDCALKVKVISPGDITLGLQQIAKSSYVIKEGLSFIVLQSAMNSEIVKYRRIFNIIKYVNGIEVTPILDEIEIMPTDVNQHYRFLEKLSLFMLALKNKHYAKVLNVYHGERKTSTVSVDDYKVLSKIYRLHKSLAWLRKYAIEDIQKPLVINNAEEIEIQEQAKGTDS